MRWRRRTGSTDVEAVTRAMTVLHATEAATVHLAVAARSEGVDARGRRRRALRRPAGRQAAGHAAHALRLPARPAPRRVGQRLGARGDVGAQADRQGDRRRRHRRRRRGLARRRPRRHPRPPRRGPRDHGRAARRGARAGRDGRRRPPTRPCDRPVPVAPWVLTHLGLEGRALRGRNAGHWRLNKPTWTTAEDWLGDVPEPLDEAAGYAELVRAWLTTFGPGTAADIQWWLGSTKTAVTRALADVDAVRGRPSTTGRRAGCRPTTSTTPARSSRGRRCCRRSTRPSWAGSRATSTSTPPTSPTSSTPTATPAPRAWWDGRIVGLLGPGRGGRRTPVAARGRGARGSRRPGARGRSGSPPGSTAP